MAEVYGDNSYNYISTATTTQVLTGNGKLHAIVVGTTAAGAITVYDNISTDVTNPIAVLKSSIGEGTYTFNARVKNGIKVVTASTPKITVLYSK